MGPDWVYAFFVATALALISTPLLRRLALATGFVDHPGRHKRHSSPIPYLGGVGLVLSVLVALILATPMNWAAAALFLGAAILGAIGLADDDTMVAPSTRFLAEVAAAAVAVGVGIRIHATGNDAVDVVVTIVWIVGITNALNLLDNMDGLAAGVAAVAALGGLVLAVAGHQHAVGALAAAVAGGSLGFLAYNRPPASIFMGDAGSLFLGFLLAVLAIEVSPSLVPAESFLVPVMLLAIPLLDTTTVTVDRLRRRRPVCLGGRDHLSHRLVAKGLEPGAAVAVLVGAEVVVATLAVLAGREALPLGWAVAGTLAVLAGLTVVTAGADVYEAPVRPPGWLLAVGGVALGAVLVTFAVVSDDAPGRPLTVANAVVEPRGYTGRSQPIDAGSPPEVVETSVLSRPGADASLPVVTIAGGVAVVGLALAVISRRRLGVRRAEAG